MLNFDPERKSAKNKDPKSNVYPQPISRYLLQERTFFLFSKSDLAELQDIFCLVNPT